MRQSRNLYIKTVAIVNRTFDELLAVNFCQKSRFVHAPFVTLWYIIAKNSAMPFTAPLSFSVNAFSLCLACVWVVKRMKLAAKWLNKINFTIGGSVFSCGSVRNLYGIPDNTLLAFWIHIGETIEDIGTGTAWLGNEGVVIHDACFSFRSQLNPKYVAYFTRTKQFHD